MSDNKLPSVNGEVRVSNLDQPSAYVTTHKRKVLLDNEDQNVSKKQKQKTRLRHSNWVITVNTNLAFPDRDDNGMQVVIKRLKHKLKELCDLEKLGSMIAFADPTHSWKENYIKHIDKLLPAIEVGRKQHQVHAHFQIFQYRYSDSVGSISYISGCEHLCYLQVCDVIEVT